MTATAKPPAQNRRPRRPVRFSSMEILGFSNPSSIWSDRPGVDVSPATGVAPHHGRHEAPVPDPDTVADWAPEDFGARLTGRNFRWSTLLVTLIVLAGAAGLGYWLHQRPVAQAEASLAALANEAQELRSALPVLEEFNDSLITDNDISTSELFAVDEAARGLFEASGDLSSSVVAVRSAAATASASALDGVRLVSDARSYRLAVTPILVAPDLETDPNLIELDEAARAFGDWQLRYDGVRTALPDGVLSNTTAQLDILSGDLPGILTRYMDALREDDQTEAEAVLDELTTRLTGVGQQMSESLIEVQTRVSERVAEARQALQSILDS